MPHNPEQIERTKRCEENTCNRSAWRRSDRCFWHTEIKNKSEDDLNQSLENVPDDLRGAYLRESDILSGTDLTGRDLSKANLSGATLEESDLRNTITNKADFSFANLSKADVDIRILRDANLVGVNLKQANLWLPDKLGSEFNESDLIDILQSTLMSQNNSIVYRGIDATAHLVENKPEMCVILGSTLLSLLNDRDLPTSVCVSAIRTLATLALEADFYIQRGDEVFAHYIKFGDDYVKKEVLSSIGPVVIQSPDIYTESLFAINSALEDPDPEVRLLAVQISTVLYHDGNLPSGINPLEVIDELYEEPIVPDEALDEAANIITSSSKQGGEI